ncbi:hypothetical protein, partial [Nocardia brasiliensis]|uniref:hypothetical protein n=1 Tax=Nocardia brasiliensis TaxID=37326 RepID=UPI002455CB96
MIEAPPPAESAWGRADIQHEWITALAVRVAADAPTLRFGRSAAEPSAVVRAARAGGGGGGGGGGRGAGGG